MAKEFGGAWPDESQYFHHFHLGGGWPLKDVPCQQLFDNSPKFLASVIFLTIRRWCSPRAAPAEVEVLATGVGPG